MEHIMCMSEHEWFMEEKEAPSAQHLLTIPRWNPAMSSCRSWIGSVGILKKKRKPLTNSSGRVVGAWVAGSGRDEAAVTIRQSRCCCLWPPDGCAAAAACSAALDASIDPQL